LKIGSKFKSKKNDRSIYSGKLTEGKEVIIVGEIFSYLLSLGFIFPNANKYQEKVEHEKKH
jgi:hypothetical protein